MKRKSRRAFALLGLLLVPLSIGASVLLIKSALTIDPNPQRAGTLAFGHHATFKALAGNSSTHARPAKLHATNAVKTDSSVESQAGTNTNVLCPENDESWAATLGLGFDFDKQCDYAAVWGELKGGAVGNSERGSHARNDSSPQSSSGNAFAAGDWNGTIAFSGSISGGISGPSYARNHDPASASGFLQQIVDSCAEGTCKTPAATDGHPSQAAPGRPGKTMTPATPTSSSTPTQTQTQPETQTPTVAVPEPGTFALLLIGACGLLLGRRLS